MSLFKRRKGRHVRHGSSTGWGGLGRLAADAAAHPVVDARISRPAFAHVTFRVAAPGWGGTTSEETR